MMIEEDERLSQLQEREKSMRQLETDIVDVNTIFKVCLYPFKPCLSIVSKYCL